MSDISLNANKTDELSQLLKWLQAKRKVALATVVKTWGSSPRPVGSHLVIDELGNFVGSVSGGCIEGAVVTEALDVLENRAPQLLEFGVSDDQAWDVGLSCGGAIHVFVQPVTESLVSQLVKDQSEKIAVASVTRFSDSEQILVYENRQSGAWTLSPTQFEKVTKLLLAGRSEELADQDKNNAAEDSCERLFVRSYLPPARMLIVGAVHIAESLSSMAVQVGFDVTVIDPRSAFLREARFSAATLSNEWPDEILERLNIDSQTAVITLTHDPKIDDPALEIAIKSDAFYIGALGSQRTHQKRVERLRKADSKARVERIHGPVGLDLGGRAPAEIAVSILAQVVEARYKGGLNDI